MLAHILTQSTLIQNPAIPSPFHSLNLANIHTIRVGISCQSLHFFGYASEAIQALIVLWRRDRDRGAVFSFFKALEAPQTRLEYSSSTLQKQICLIPPAEPVSQINRFLYVVETIKMPGRLVILTKQEKSFFIRLLILISGHCRHFMSYPNSFDPTPESKVWKQ